MDGKKNLTPELKQIYERVMNTPVKAQVPPAQQTPAQASSSPAPATPVAPAQPQAAAASIPQAGVQKPAAQAPPAGPLTTPLRPVAPDKPFTYTANGKKIVKVDEHPEKAKAASPTKRSLMPLVLGGGALFLVAYTVFWMKFFKLF